MAIVAYAEGPWFDSRAKQLWTFTPRSPEEGMMKCVNAKIPVPVKSTLDKWRRRLRINQKGTATQKCKWLLARIIAHVQLIHLLLNICLNIGDIGICIYI